MAELGLVAWPPAAIRTERLVLRESEARDRAAFIELFASPEVGTYIGGPRPRDELERSVPEDAVRIASPQLRRMVIGQAQDIGRKRHLVVDTRGLPLLIMVTPADLHDSQAPPRKSSSGSA